MKFFKNKYSTIILAFISIIIFVGLFKWTDYLIKNNYIVECFQQATSHTVNLPLTTTESCQNFCGPNSTCSITGEQCTSDIDCHGCKKKTSVSTKLGECIPGENDAGKLTWGFTPQYSTLTTDIGTQAAFYTSNPLQKPAMANFGINTWIQPFKQSSKMFNKRYVTPELQFMPNYAKRYTATGQFIDNGPIASNDYITLH
jgi:hypothetical protein